MSKIVGETILTLQGLRAYEEASLSGTSIKPKYFVFSDKDYELDVNLETLNGWIQKDISAYLSVDTNTADFLCLLNPDEATSYCRICGLFLETGELFAIAKPSYPLPPSIAQKFWIQIKYGNLQTFTDFSYIPFDSICQDLSLLNMQLTTAKNSMNNARRISLLEEKILRR